MLLTSSTKIPSELSLVVCVGSSKAGAMDVYVYIGVVFPCGYLTERVGYIYIPEFVQVHCVSGHRPSVVLNEADCSLKYRLQLVN